MTFLQTVLTSVFSVLALFILTRLTGARQISQLSVFDYINGITVGSIAADLAVAKEEDFFHVLISFAVFGFFTLLFAFLTDKSILARRIITGGPILLFSKGRIFKDNFKAARLDINEFLMQCRSQGYFDISKIDTAYLEPNGLVSILPVTADMPATPKDIKVDVKQEQIPVCVIVDGKIMHKNLQEIGFSTGWLEGMMGATDPHDVFLATCTPDGTLNIYQK